MLVVLDVGTTQFTQSSDKTGIYKNTCTQNMLTRILSHEGRRYLPTQRFTSDGRGVMRFESAEACRVSHGLDKAIVSFKIFFLLFCMSRYLL